MNNISLVTMSHGNPEALKRTLDSFKDVVDEVIYGDLIVFENDREVVKSYRDEYKMKIIKFPFNYIFLHGFSAALNVLAHNAKNDLVVYMNCSEIIDGEHRIAGLLDFFSKYNFNCYPFDHATDPHTWYRLYKKSELKWSGLIHEELVGDKRPASHYLFRMADTEKDMTDPFKAKVMNDIKEIVYFHQYIKMVESPESMGATSSGWLDWAQTQYESMKERLRSKGSRYDAFLHGDLDMYFLNALSNPEFQQEKFESNTSIEFQGDPKYLGK